MATGCDEKAGTSTSHGRAIKTRAPSRIWEPKTNTGKTTEGKKKLMGIAKGNSRVGKRGGIKEGGKDVVRKIQRAKN